MMSMFQSYNAAFLYSVFDRLSNKVIKRNTLMVSNLNSFSVKLLPNPYVESTTIRFVGWLPCFLAICKIMVNCFFKRNFNSINSVPFIGDNISNKKKLAM